MSMTKIITTVHYILPDEAKQYFEKNKDLYVLVFGGGQKRLESLNDKWMLDNCIADDSCADNISYLNPYLNELTTIYLIYKNLRLLDGHTANIGHNHYRRFFNKDVLNDIDTVDGIIANPIGLGVAGFSCTLEKQYELCHYKEDFDILKQTIIDEGLMDAEVWKAWTNLNYLFAPCNLFCLKRECFNMMISDVLKVALRLPQLIDIKGRDDYQRRACSFLCERLLSYWFFKQAARGRCRWKVVDLEYHPDWKGTNSIDKRGCFDGVFKGDQSVKKVNEYIKTR